MIDLRVPARVLAQEREFVGGEVVQDIGELADGAEIGIGGGRGGGGGVDGDECAARVDPLLERSPILATGLSPHAAGTMIVL